MRNGVSETDGMHSSISESYRILPWVGFLIIVALAALGGVLLSGMVDSLV